MKRPPTLLSHHGLFDHSRKAVCEGGGEQRKCSTEAVLFGRAVRSEPHSHERGD